MYVPSTVPSAGDMIPILMELLGPEKIKTDIHQYTRK